MAAERLRSEQGKWPYPFAPHAGGPPFRIVGHLSISQKSGSYDWQTDNYIEGGPPILKELWVRYRWYWKKYAREGGIRAAGGKRAVWIKVVKEHLPLSGWP
ncbi:hypothetical protein SUGI_0390360 [Cryptomeria japonica]|nr:hypothetical protein SUGI_0390360 [Cryptomeria japonica]